MCVAFLINFGVKNQAPQFSFEIVAGDLMLVFFYDFADIMFYGYLDILEIYHILGVIHSLSLTLSFQEIPTRLNAPILRVLKKEKIMHLPSRWSTWICSTLLDMIRTYLDLI